MRWGVRNDRDRQANKLARRKKNEQKYINKAKVFQTKIDTLNTSPFNYNSYVTRSELERKRDKAIKDAELKSKGKLSTNQKTVAIGAAAVGVILAYKAHKSMQQSGEMGRLITKGKELFSDKQSPGWKLDRSLSDSNKSVDEIFHDVVSKINPNYGTPGTKANCRRATYAYEMRRRGYDVKATKTTIGTGQNTIGVYNAASKERDIVPATIGGKARKMFTDKVQKKTSDSSFTSFLSSPQAKNKLGQAHMFDLPGSKHIFSELGKQPNGARGEFSMQWISGGGHSMAWEIVNGKPVIFDNQNGKVYRNATAFKKISLDIGAAGFTRLDNISLNSNFLMRWVTNA